MNLTMCCDKGHPLKRPVARKEITDRVRCNNCGGIFNEDIKECPKCKTDAYLMQPFVESIPQHTPGPYIVGDQDDANIIYDQTAGDRIAECENPHTAAFIAHAANNHKSLLQAMDEACKLISLPSAWESCDKETGEECKGLDCHRAEHAALCILENAITRAEGRP